MNILVFSRIRTGVKTLVKSLNNSGIECKDGVSNIGFSNKYNQSLYEYLKNSDQKTIIRIYRTPIEQLLSSFFMLNYSDLNNDIFDIFDLEKLNTQFINSFHTLSKILVDNQVDLYLKENGLEETKFDLDKKYNKNTINNITSITVRFNEITEWDNILSNALNKKIKMSNDNKNYHTKFNELRESLLIDMKIYRYIESDKKLKIFLSESERRKYLNFWRQRIRK